MRIYVQDFSGHPFQAQLSRALAQRGHDVVHSSCASYASGHGALYARPDDPESLEFDQISMGKEFQKYRYHRRVPQEIAYGLQVVRRLRRHRADVYLSCNEPLLAKVVIGTWCRLRGQRWVFWVQDLYSVAMRRELTTAYGRIGAVLGAVFERLEAWLLRSADGVVAISPAFLGWMRKRRVRREDVVIVPNWAPLEEIEYHREPQGWFERKLGIPADAPVALYSGTLGRKHDASMFVAMAERLARQGGHVVVVSQGDPADDLARQAAAGHPNLWVLPFQPWEEVPSMLASAAVLLAVLDENAAQFSVPSKVLTYLCAGRPIVASIDAANLAAEHILEADAGLVTPPGDARALTDAVARLLPDQEERERMGKCARAFAERTFDVERIASRFEATFAAVARDQRAVAVPATS